MKSTKKILFITWDGPQTNYLESLFFPIFSSIQKKSVWRFQVVQFSWAEKEQQQHLSLLAGEKGIGYRHYPVGRKPYPLPGTLLTLMKGVVFLKQYLKHHPVDLIMPRSIIPALMVNFLTTSGCKIIFDADGLPLEERVDFSGLSRKSLQYKFLKKQEKKMLVAAEKVFTRSDQAIKIHLKTVGKSLAHKFQKITNGRDKVLFSPDPVIRGNYRKKLHLRNEDLLLVYCGSLGPQYGWQEMMKILSLIRGLGTSAKLLVLTKDSSYIINRIPDELVSHILIKKEPFGQIPAWLNAADVAFAIREPLPSMLGVAPIKLAEYLLMGLPTIASKGIGDTESILQQIPGTFLYDHSEKEMAHKAALWATRPMQGHPQAIRERSIKHFSLEMTVKDYMDCFNTLK